MAELIEGPIPIERVLSDATRSECGAVTMFLGTTRDHQAKRKVVHLLYEAHRPMALAALEKVERDAVDLYEVTSCRVVHRLGEVPAGEASVAIVVVATHRAAAFDACRWAIDELKTTAPIWKKEFYDDGSAEWVGGSPLQ